MSNPARIRRLENDFRILMNISQKSKYISIEPKEGNPPYKYLITYNVPGYISQSGSTCNTHYVDIYLPEGYPIQEPPRFHFRENLWHPNVFPGGDVCLGLTEKNWSFGFDIDQLVYDIGNMIRFSLESINLDSLAQMTLEKSGWESWMRKHKIPLADIDFNVSDVPVVKIKEQKKIDIKIKGKKEKLTKIKIKEIN
jgi:ubiquitin-protein ligase